jgi:hypothetical protein
VTALVTSRRFRTEDYTQDGKAIDASGLWYQAETGCTFKTGERIMSRFAMDIPRGATIVSAVWKFEIGIKTPANASVYNLNVGFHDSYNSPRWPEADVTAAPGITIPSGMASVPITVSYPGGPTPDPDFVSVTVTSQLQAVINKEDWEAGNYVTVITTGTKVSGEDMSMNMRDQAFAADQPTLLVTWSIDDAVPDTFDVNLHRGQRAAANVTADRLQVSATNNHYASHAEGTTWALDTAKAPPLGLTDAVKIMANPPAGQEDRAFGINSYEEARDGEWVVLSGWFFNPSYNVSDFRAQDVYVGGGTGTLPERNKWTPFVGAPIHIFDTDVPSDNRVALRPEVMINSCKRVGGTNNAEFWVAGLTYTRFRDKPDSPPRMHPFLAGGSPLTPGREFRHSSLTTNRDTSVRRCASSTYVLDGAVAKPRRKWAQSSAGSAAFQVPLVPTSTRKPSVLVGTPIGLVGSATLTPGVSYQGRTWTRLTAQVANHGSRTLAPLSRLQAGQMYVGSAGVANDGAPAVPVNLDWCDVGVASFTIQPGEVRTISTIPAVTTYDSTFRFLDLTLPVTGGSGILIYPPELRVTQVNPGPWTSVPVGRWVDIETSKTWAEL